MVSVIVRSILVQLATPDEMRGRVNAVDMIFIGVSNELGQFESGPDGALVWDGTRGGPGRSGTTVVIGSGRGPSRNSEKPTKSQTRRKPGRQRTGRTKNRQLIKA